MKLLNLLLICLLTGQLAAAQIQVSGVVSGEDGQPLSGVSVRGEEGEAVQSDDAGMYRIRVKSRDGKLTFSRIGYKTEVKQIEGNTVLNVMLISSIDQLDEVIVVGYGTTKKEHLTGAVAQVDSRMLENRPVTNIGKALQGVIGNLNMTVGSDGGTPGSGMNYNVRGTTSLSGGGPLFIVDGVPTDNINKINPTDIEKITVLKDAAAAAIYGARASYGVILVTTKGGEKNGRTNVTFSSIIGQNIQTIVPNQVNSLEFANAYNIASLNSGQSPMFSEEHIERIKAYIADPVNTPPNVVSPTDMDLWSYANLDNDNVDWYRAFFKPNSMSTKHDLSVDGGTEKFNYYLSGGYYQENSYLRYADERFKRLTFTSNLRIAPTKWLRADVRLRFNNEKRNNVSSSYDGDIGNWAHLASTRYPNWSLKDPNGHWASTSHMTKLIDGGRSLADDNVFNGTFALEAEPIKGWKINADYTYRNNDSEGSTHAKPVIWEYTVSESPIMTTAHDAFSTLQSRNEYSSLNAYSSYEKGLGAHNFFVLIGQQLELNQYNYLTAMRRGLINHDMPSLATATGAQTNSQILSHWANMGTFIRANYNYDERYLLEFNARYDGSSRFQEGRRFGFFPSISAAYNIAKEKFWHVDFVNSLKLRASYGSLGNQNVSNYLYLSTLPVGSDYGYLLNGIRPNTLAAPGLVSRNLTWEMVSTVNGGVDASFLSNRLNASLDIYTRTTTGMFGPANALPAILGASVPQENNADLKTSGFELSIGWQDRTPGDFAYRVSFVLSDYLSKVTKYNNPSKLLSTYYAGQTLGQIWGYQTVGVIQTEEQLNNIADQSYIYGNWTLGDIQYRDRNNDGKIDIGKNTVDDHGDLVVIGNTTPRYGFGLSLGADWRNFDLNLFLQGVGKQDFNPPTGGNSAVFFWGFTGGFGSNLYEDNLDYWTPENTNAYFSKPYTTSEVWKNQQAQTRYLQNAAYARLKSIQLGYTLPVGIAGKVGLANARLFFSGENLFTVTGLHKSLDPELLSGSWGAGKMYPLSRTFSFGLNLGF